MSLQQTSAKFKTILSQIGRASLHSLFPNEFEFYSLGFELTDSHGNIVEMLVFPIMPDQITETNPNIVNVKKSSYGVVSLHNSSFSPFNISMTGNFGRKLRVLLGNRELNGTSTQFSGVKSGSDVPSAIFNTQIKTGYGTIKALEHIIKRSFDVDSYGGAHRLYLYNSSLNSNNLVEVLSFNKNQNRGTNMIWNYNIEMKAIAPASISYSNSSKSASQVIKFTVLNNAMNLLMGSFRDEFNIRQQKKITAGQ